MSLEAIQTKLGEIQTKLTSDLAAQDANLKKSLETIESLRKQGEQTDTLVRSLQKAQLDLVSHQRAATGSGIARIQADPAKRNLVNAAVRALTKSPLSETHRKALGEDTSPGSIFVMTQLANEIYDVLQTYGQYNTLAVRQLGTKTTTYPVKTARPLANWILTEGGQITDDSTKAGTSVDLTVKLMAVLIDVSRQLLEDAEYDLTADVMDDMAQALAYRLDWAAFAADGTADVTDGGFTGIFAGGTAANAAAGNTTVADLDYDDVLRCLTAAPAGILRRPCRWWIHPTILTKMLAIKDGNKRPIFQNALEAPAPGAIGSILGYPVVLVEAAPSTDTAGKPVAVFGAPEGCIVGIRRDFEFGADDSHKWDYFQRSFRGIGRAGVKIRNATSFQVLTTAAQ